MEPVVPFILFISGIFAGVVTGFVGASAAIVITPVLAIFLGYEPFVAVGIALATDVFASLTATGVYYVKGRVQVTKGLLMTACAVAGALFGSIFSYGFPGDLLVYGTSIVVVLLGIQLMRRPIHEQIEDIRDRWDIDIKDTRPVSVGIGLVLGFIAGVFGAGGGLNILIVLTVLLGYSLIDAVGTSVLMMTFIALSGALGHFIYTGVPPELLYSVIGGIIGAGSTSLYANSIKKSLHSRIIGICIFSLGGFMLLRILL